MCYGAGRIVHEEGLAGADLAHLEDLYRVHAGVGIGGTGG